MKIYQNLQKIVKAIARGKFIELNTYIGKGKKIYINDLIFHIKKLEKDQIKPKVYKGRKLQTLEHKSIQFKTQKQLKRINESKC